MFNTTTQTKAFNSIISSVLFWIGIENSNCSASLIALAEQLPLTTIERARLRKIINIYDAMFESRSYSEIKSSLTAATIPDKYAIDNESAYAYVMLTSIMNFVSAELYNEASAVLIEMSGGWREIYVKAIAAIADMNNCEDFCRWCVTHSIVAMDIKKTNFLDYGNFAAMYDENGFADLMEQTEEDDEDDDDF